MENGFPRVSVGTLPQCLSEAGGSPNADAGIQTAVLTLTSVVTG